MCINVLQAAKYLCEQSGWKYTNLELQKMIYLAHMFYLGDTNAPLVEGNFEAWKYGPVHPDLYYHISYFGASPIKKIAFDDKIKDLNLFFHKRQLKELNEAVKTFSPGSGPKLMEITHLDGGAWKKLYQENVNNITISNQDILEEYNTLWRD